MLIRDESGAGWVVEIKSRNRETRSSMEAISKQDAIYDAEDQLCDELQEEIKSTKAKVKTKEEWSSFLDTIDARQPKGCILIGDERGIQGF